jgi:ribosomal protein L7Ae-like RNA K-turn-binding protein
LGLGSELTEVSARQLSQSAAEQYGRRASGLLQAGHRARKLVMGTDATRDALHSGKVHALLIARDAEGSRDELARAAERLGARCFVWSTKEELGRLFGRAMLSIVGVLDDGIATELRHVVRCAAELAEDA